MDAQATAVVIGTERTAREERMVVDIEKAVVDVWSLENAEQLSPHCLDERT